MDTAGVTTTGAVPTTCDGVTIVGMGAVPGIAVATGVTVSTPLAFACTVMKPVDPGGDCC